MNKIFITLISMLIAFNSAFACDAKKDTCECAKKEKPLWDRGVVLGFNKTTGNSDVFGLNAGIYANTEQDKNIFIFDAKTFYSEQENLDTKIKDTTVNKSIGLAQYNRLLNDRLYAGLGVNFLRDEVADLKYRVTPALALGYYWIKNDNIQLSTEAGPAYVFEKLKDTENNYLSPYIGERFDWELSEASSLFQSAKVFFDIDDSDNYLAIGEIGVKAELMENVSLILSLQDTFDNVPATGKEKNDFIIVNSLGVSF